jgi:hypothetical protein
MKKSFIIIIMVLTSTIFSYAQTSNTEKENYFGIGAYASLENGFGFSGRYDLSEKFSVQGTVMLPIFLVTNYYEEGDNRYGSTTRTENSTVFLLDYTCFGATLLYNIFKSTNFREYLYLSTAYHYMHNTPFDNYKYNEARNFFDFGGGLGLEFVAGTIGFNIQLGQVLVVSPDRIPKSNTSVGGGILFYLK